MTIRRRLMGDRGWGMGAKLSSSIFLFTLFPLLPSPFSHPSAYAVEPVQATAKVLKNKIKIGDEIRFLVQIERPRKFSVIPPAQKIDLSPFEVKSRDPEATIKGSNRVLETYGYTLTVFELGDLQIPSVTIHYRDESGRTNQARTEPMPVKVISVGKKLTDKDDIRPIKGPVSTGTQRFWNRVVGILVTILSVCLIVSVARRWWKARKEAESRKPPHVRARLELGRLKDQGLLEEKKFKEYYSGLSDILRRYMERAMKLEALERTTFEITEEMKRKNFDALSIGKIKTVLEDTDLVKFAKHVPDRATADRLEALLLEVVELTKPADVKKKP